MESTRSSLSRHRVFLVDDHPIVRHGFRNLISAEADLEVCGEAADVDDALRQLDQARPDVMVVDLSLRAGHGLDLIREVRSRNASIKLLVSTRHDEALFAERSLRAGASGFVKKAESPDRIVDAIRAVLRGEVYLSPRMKDRFLHRMIGGELADKDPLDKLTDRELQVFELIGEGLATKQIAAKLELSVKTVDAHREHIRSKLGLQSGADLTRHAVQWVLEE